MTFFDFFKVVGKSILFTIFFVFGADFCDFWLLAVPERCPGDNGGAGVGVQSVPNLDLAAVSGPYGSSRTRKSPPYGCRTARKLRSPTPADAGNVTNVSLEPTDDDANMKLSHGGATIRAPTGRIRSAKSVHPNCAKADF